MSNEQTVGTWGLQSSRPIYQKQPSISVLMAIKKKLSGRSPQANYTDRETAACRRS
jgi:hypothetical protein